MRYISGFLRVYKFGNVCQFCRRLDGIEIRTVVRLAAFPAQERYFPELGFQYRKGAEFEFGVMPALQPVNRLTVTAF